MEDFSEHTLLFTHLLEMFIEWVETISISYIWKQNKIADFPRSKARYFGRENVYKSNKAIKN